MEPRFDTTKIRRFANARRQEEPDADWTVARFADGPLGGLEIPVKRSSLQGWFGFCHSTDEGLWQALYLHDPGHDVMLFDGWGFSR